MSDNDLTVIEVPIEDLIPYDNNPRRIPKEAIDAVAVSISTFGWQQPIVVDKNNVIIVGHTRRMAALQLGLKTVPVHVADLTEEKAKEYRLIDNKTSEMSAWDHNALILELREFDADLLQQFFPEVDLEVSIIEGMGAPTQREIDEAERKVTRVNEASDESQHLTQVVCPSCFHQFNVRTRSLPGGLSAIEELMRGDGKQ